MNCIFYIPELGENRGASDTWPCSLYLMEPERRNKYIHYLETTDRFLFRENAECRARGQKPCPFLRERN